MIFINFIVGINFAIVILSVYLQISLPPLPALLLTIMRVFYPFTTVASRNFCGHILTKL